MKKILVASDTHGRNENLKNVILKNRPIDKFIFCGDGEGLEKIIREMIGDECELYMVRGNNDFFSSLDREREIRIGQYRVLLTHGHYYNVSLGTETIKKEAAARNVDIVMFGHTHRPCYEVQDDIIAVNPGSLSYPRQEGHTPSYMVMSLDKKGRAHFDLNYIEKGW